MSLNNYDIRVISCPKIRQSSSAHPSTFHHFVIFKVPVLVLALSMLLVTCGCHSLGQLIHDPDAPISPLTALAKPRIKKTPLQLNDNAPISHEDAASLAMSLDEPLEQYDVLRPGGPANINSMQRSTVLRAVDGDTLMVLIDDKPTRLRLIGIDAPESYSHHDKNRRTHLGESVSRIVQAWLTDKTVYLEYDTKQEDQYGRLLAYVWIDNHQMINEILAREGLVDVKCYKPNVRYDNYFAMLEHLAKKEQRGIWATPIFANDPSE
ncbi:MAG: hypothetical protein GX939_04000 [Clostridiaceae bacterium]|jgi:micrococcal nuclease|nr:hypothetical protein [Clostridiaceae bacterium]